jgi:hypothetical protein
MSKSYIRSSSSKVIKERKEFSLFGTINIFIKEPLPEGISMTNVVMDLEDTIPPHLLYEVETIIVGQFKDLNDRGVRAAYMDGGIYVTNQQPSDEQLFEDIVHEIAHSVEKMLDYDIYADGRLETEYLGKRKRFIDLMVADGVRIPNRLRYETEYSKPFDEFLHYDLGYDRAINYAMGLFISPYASVSVSEYFATGFEMFFVQADSAQIKEMSPELFNKLNDISKQGE